MSLLRVGRVFPIAGASSYSTASNSNQDINPVVYNRNPRNLERLRIAYKPFGYWLQREKTNFWHKVVLEKGNRSVRASIVHFSGKVVVDASTSEWAIKKFLYRSTDTAAYINLAKVFAERCHESGISEIFCDLDPKGEKVSKFLEQLEKCGMTLREPGRYLPFSLHHRMPLEKPWEVTEETA